MAFYTDKELETFGFKYLGNNVKISTKSSIYKPDNISISDNSRIDDFCILSAGEAGIFIGRFVHVACYSSMIGQGKIILEDFCNVSSKVSIYSSSDDFTGSCLTNPTVPEELSNVKHSDVILRKHVVVGSGSVILPGVEIGKGVAIGALSLVSKNCESFWIYGGVPVRKIKKRKMDLLKLEKELLASTMKVRP